MKTRKKALFSPETINFYQKLTTPYEFLVLLIMRKENIGVKNINAVRFIAFVFSNRIMYVII